MRISSSVYRADYTPRHNVYLLRCRTYSRGDGALGTGALAPAAAEFTFRFNRRKSTSWGKLFFRLAQQAVQMEPVPFDSLIDHNL